MWLNFLKVLLLMVGVTLVGGGGLAGLCGAVANKGDVVLLALVPIALGVWLFIAVARTYKGARKAEPAVAESGDKQPPAEPRP